MKVKAVKVNRAHYFLTDPRILYFILKIYIKYINIILRIYIIYTQNKII